MENPKQDRRIIRTKRMIRDALTELLERKSFEEITVKDITEAADINRGTFYLHYESKYDLLEKSGDEILEEMEKFLRRISTGMIIRSQTQNEPVPFLVNLFEVLQQNAHFLKVILGPKGDPVFQVKIKKFIKDNFLEKVMRHSQEEDLLVPIEHLMAYVSSAHLGVIQQWLEGGTKESPRDMALILSKITFHGPAYVVGIRKD